MRRKTKPRRRSRDLPNKPGVVLMRDKLGSVHLRGKARALASDRPVTFIRSARLRVFWGPEDEALIRFQSTDFERVVLVVEERARGRGS